MTRSRTTEKRPCIHKEGSWESSVVQRRSCSSPHSVCRFPFLRQVRSRRPSRSMAVRLSAGPLSGLLQGQVLGTAEGVWRQSEGRISGVLQDETGRPLANQRVELARPSRDGSGRFVTTTDIRGAFSYVGLEPGRYEVLYRVDGEIVARSGPLDLVAGAMQLSGVALRADPGRGRGLHPAVWVGIAAAAIMATAALTCFVADTDRRRR